MVLNGCLAEEDPIKNDQNKIARVYSINIDFLNTQPGLLTPVINVM